MRRTSKRLRANWPLLAAAAFAFFNAIIWSLSIPAGQAPDEPTHFAVSAFEAREHRIPEFGIDEGMGVTVSPTPPRFANVSYAGQPQLPYLLGAAFIALPTDSEWMDYRQGRAPGAFYAIVIVLAGYGLARRVTGSRPISLASGFVLAAWPQISFVTAYVNVDGYSLAAGILLMATWWRAHDHGWQLRDTALVGAASGLVMLGKLTGYPLLLLTAIVVLTAGPGVARVASRALVVAGMALVVAGWWFAIAWSMYGSDIFAAGRAADLAKAGNAITNAGVDQGLTVWTMLTDTVWLASTLRSFIGVFGWLDTPISGWLYLLYGSLALMGLTGLLLRATDRRPRLAGLRSRRGVLLAMTFAPLLLMPALSLRHSLLVDFQAQGRYLFPALAPLVVALLVGIATLGSTVARERRLLAFVAIAMLAGNLIALTDTVTTKYEVPIRSWIDDWQVVFVAAWAAALVASMAAAVSLARSAQPTVE